MPLTLTLKRRGRKKLRAGLRTFEQAEREWSRGMRFEAELAPFSMKKPVEFVSAAQDEYLAVLTWYLERSTSAAARFEAEVETALERIQEAPTRWPNTWGAEGFYFIDFPLRLSTKNLSSSFEYLPSHISTGNPPTGNTANSHS